MTADNSVDWRNAVYFPRETSTWALKRSSWFSTIDMLGWCCPCDIAGYAYRYWRTSCLSFRSRDIGISVPFHIHVWNVSACCPFYWTSCSISDRNISGRVHRSRRPDDLYGTLEKKKQIEFEVSKNISTKYIDVSNKQGKISRGKINLRFKKKKL